MRVGGRLYYEDIIDDVATGLPKNRNTLDFLTPHRSQTYSTQIWIGYIVVGVLVLTGPNVNRPFKCFEPIILRVKGPLLLPAV